VRGALFLCTDRGARAGESGKKRFFVDLTNFASREKNKNIKNEFFYKKPLTNDKKGDKIVNCIIIARIAETLVKAAK